MALFDSKEILNNDIFYTYTDAIALKANQGDGFSIYDDAAYTTGLPSNVTSKQENFGSYIAYGTWNDNVCDYNVSVGPTIIVNNNAETDYPKKVNSSWLSKADKAGTTLAYYNSPWLTNIYNENGYTASDSQYEGFTCNECNGCFDVCAGCFSMCVDCTAGCTSGCTSGCLTTTVYKCVSCDNCTGCAMGCTSTFSCISMFSCTAGCFTTCQGCADACVHECNTGCNEGCTSGCYEFCTASCANSCNASDTSCNSCTACNKCVSSY